MDSDILLQSIRGIFIEILETIKSVISVRCIVDEV